MKGTPIDLDLNELVRIELYVEKSKAMEVANYSEEDEGEMKDEEGKEGDEPKIEEVDEKRRKKGRKRKRRSKRCPTSQSNSTRTNLPGYSSLRK